MTLTVLEEIIPGILDGIFFIVCLFIGSLFIMKYARNKQFKELFSLGVAWIFMGLIWIGSAITCIAMIFIDFELNLFWLVLMTDIFIAPSLLFWMHAFFNITNVRKRREYIIAYSIILGVFEIYIVIAAVINPSLLGILLSNYYILRIDFPTYFFIALMLISIIYAIYSFVHQALKTDDKKVNWKGRIILFAFIFFLTGLVIAFFLNQLILVTIGKLLMIFSVIMFYLGYFLPEKIFNRLII